jgi:hypothetical protein
VSLGRCYGSLLTIWAPLRELQIAVSHPLAV